MTTKRLPDSLKEASEFQLSNITNDTFIPLFTKMGSTEVMKKIKANVLNSGGGSTPAAQPDRVIIIDTTLEQNIEGKAYKTFTEAKTYMESINDTYFQVELPVGEFSEQVTVSKNYFVHGNSTILTSKLNSNVCFTPQTQEILADSAYISGVTISGGFMVNPDFNVQNYEFTFYSLKDCIVLNNEISDENSLDIIVATNCEFKTQKTPSQIGVFAYYCKIHCLYAYECFIFHSIVMDIDSTIIDADGCTFILMGAFESAEVPTISGFRDINFINSTLMRGTSFIFKDELFDDREGFKLNNVYGENIKLHADDETDAAFILNFNSCNLSIGEVTEFSPSGKSGGMFDKININSNSCIELLNNSSFPNTSLLIEDSTFKMSGNTVINGLSARNHSNVMMSGTSQVDYLSLDDSNLTFSGIVTIDTLNMHPFSKLIKIESDNYSINSLNGCADVYIGNSDILEHVTNNYIPKSIVFSNDKTNFTDDESASYIGFIKDNKRYFSSQATANYYVWVDNITSK